MYRLLLKSYNSRSDQLHKNKLNTDSSKKWCNFLCQNLLPIDQFYKKSAMNYCIKCSNHLNIAKKMIKEEKITIEQFKNDPQIVFQKKKASDSTIIVCDKCKIEKTEDFFSAYRKTCKECRKEQNINRTQQNLDSNIELIEKSKENKENLAEVLRKMSVSTVQQIVKHYCIGRHKDDKKDDSIAKIIKHFEQLQSPYKCLGNCGFVLQETFSYCIACKKDPNARKVYIEEKNLEFKENLEMFMSTLVEIKKDEEYEYNLIKLRYICQYLKIDINTKSHSVTKKQMIDAINKTLQQKEKEKEKEKEKIATKSLLFEELGISSRKDGYIDASQMCKVRNKFFADWIRLESTKELIKELEESLMAENSDMEPISLLDIKKGGTNQGSWIHPDLAVNLAIWIDKKFAIHVSRFVRELAISGHCTSEKKTSNELLQLQQEYDKLKITHRKLLEKKQHHKFKKGPVFYIISDTDSKNTKYKPGIETVDINIRLAQHRSTTPCIKLEFLIYTKDCSLIEKTVLKRYETKRYHLNHEWIYDVEIDHIIKSVKTQLDFMSIDHTIEENLSEYNLHIS